jgi:ribosomal protein S18 acetylase RimI-like enzyme
VDPDELGRAMAAALRAKTLAIAGGEVAEVGGFQVYLSHLPDPAENFAFVASEPSDPAAALAETEAVLEHNGMPFGLGVLGGRHPRVDAAVRAAGYRVLFEEPAMVARVADLRAAPIPSGVSIAEARSDDLPDAAGVDALAFDSDIEVSRGMYGGGLLAIAHVFVATLEGRIVGVTTGLPTAGATALFGVAVVPEARRRGIGAALTCAAAGAGGDAGIAWLTARGDAARLYERLGFRQVALNQVWVR